MVRLVRDKENRISVKVTATVDYTGFSATLRVAGANKSIANLKAGNLRLDFTPEAVNEIGSGAEGFITVFNKKGDIYVTNRVWFSAVDNEGDAVGYQKISIVLVSMLKYEGGRRPSAESQTSAETEAVIQAKVEAAVASAMTEAIDAKVEAAVDGMIDQKVEASVSGIVEEQVTTVVNNVIDTKVEEQVNALFDDSDSDTIGGQFVMLQETVEDIEPRVEVVEQQISDNIEPRLAEAETTIAKKISMDYEDSDEGIAFFTEVQADEDSSAV